MICYTRQIHAVHGMKIKYFLGFCCRCHLANSVEVVKHVVCAKWKFHIVYLLEFGRPKSLLVFVNPIAGRGRAVKTYAEKVAPLFELAGISTEVIQTERRHQANEMVRRLNLDTYDGSVCFIQRAIDGLISVFILFSLVYKQLKRIIHEGVPTVLPPDCWNCRIKYN